MMTRAILLVDDEENDVFFFQRAMNKAGMTNTLQIVHDGQSAIDYLNGAAQFTNRLQFPLPGLVLLDLKLPLVMGLDVLKWIRQRPELGVIVIILSSSREQQDVGAAYRLGANAYLVKPTDTSKLGEMARAIHDFWLTQNTPPPDSEPGFVLETRATPHLRPLPEYRSPSIAHSLAPSPSKSLRNDI